MSSNGPCPNNIYPMVVHFQKICVQWWFMFVEDRFFNPCHINILLIFWVNLLKAQNKLISYSTIWIGLTWPARSLLQETDSWSNFFFINWDHNPWYHQHQHMDRAWAINQSSLPILLLLHSWQTAYSTRAHIYIKWQQNPRYIISSLTYDPSS